MEEVIICGTDAHDNSLVNRIGVNSSEPETRIYDNTRNGRQMLFGYLKKVAADHGAKRIVLAYEASTLGFGIYDDCVAGGIECYVLAPTKIKRSYGDGKRKTDVKDAQLILETLKGHIMAGNVLPSIWIPDRQTRDDRELVRCRLDAAQKLTVVKIQVQTLLKRNAVVKPKSAGSPWTKTYWKWLVGLDLPSGAHSALSSLLRQIENAEEEIELLNVEIERLSRTDRYSEPVKAVVEQIKGVGLLTAMVYLTEMGDLSRFSNRKKIGAFLGLAPSSRESGENNDHKGHITHEGPFRVRKVLCQATWCRVREDAAERAVYERLVGKNPKHKKIAVVACMRRLAIRMWHIAAATQVKAKVFQSAA
jgi:transposase